MKYISRVSKVQKYKSIKTCNQRQIKCSWFLRTLAFINITIINNFYDTKVSEKWFFRAQNYD